MIWFKFCRVVGFVVFDKYMKNVENVLFDCIYVMSADM